MKKKKVICFVVALLSFSVLLIGCESVAKTLPTRLTPIRIEDGYQYFRFQKQATNFQNDYLESSKYEKERMKILEMWLGRSGYKNSEYEIVSRQCIFAGKPLLGGTKIYNIYYEIKVKHEEKKVR